MKSTSVKDVGSVFNVLPKTAASKGSTAPGFQEIFNTHTDRGSLQKEKANAGESLKAKESRKADVPQQRRNKPAKASGEDRTAEVQETAAEGISEKEMQKAMEALGSAAAQLLTELAEAFGLSEEELAGMLDQLGMGTLDVLNPEKLSELLLMAGGAENTFSLLTNGELYDNYRAVMGELDALLQQMSGELDMEPQQLMELIAAENSPEGNAELPEEPVTVQVETEAQVNGEEPEESVSHKNVGEEGSTEAAEKPEKALTTEKADRSGEQGRSSGEEHQGQTGNLLLQNLRNESFQNQVQQPAAVADVWNADTQDIMRQILDYMKINVKPVETTLEMQIHPENLGTVHVQVASRGGALTAHFVTQNEAVKAAIESQMIQLKESFHEQGVRVEAIEVTVQAHEFERSFEESRGGRQENHAGRSSRPRRINLNEPLDLEDMEEEDLLAAEMMSAQGTTVDFTA